jgi:hypothetical protein
LRGGDSFDVPRGFRGDSRRASSVRFAAGAAMIRLSCVFFRSRRTLVLCAELGFVQCDSATA